MKARKFKELISQIPDEDEIIFTYSMFEFDNASSKLYNGKEIADYFDYDDEDY